MNSEALSYILNYLKIPHTKFEVISKLKNKTINEYEIEEITDYLIKKRYIDDDAYARAYIDYHLFEKMESKKAISYKLLKKGIEKDIMNKVFESVQGYDESEIIFQKIRKRFKNEDLNDKIVQSKIKKYFYNKGFSYEAINNAIIKLIDL